VNKSQLEARRKANEQLGIWISNQMSDLKTKGFTEDQAFAKYQKKAQEFLEEKETLDRAASAIEAGETLMKKLGGNVGNARGVDSGFEVKAKATGAQVSPLAFSEQSLKAMHKAFKSRQPLTIEAVRAVGRTAEPRRPLHRPEGRPVPR
jgi:hypothetical protein